MEEKITFENKITTPFTWVGNGILRSKSISLGIHYIVAEPLACNDRNRFNDR
jgi:hypothetical protein